jgi:hypothetical protein
MSVENIVVIPAKAGTQTARPRGKRVFARTGAR